MRRRFCCTLSAYCSDNPGRAKCLVYLDCREPVSEPFDRVENCDSPIHCVPPGTNGSEASAMRSSGSSKC
eukprot:15093072-Alexandrium_andersonii.AAC.1